MEKANITPLNVLTGALVVLSGFLGGTNAQCPPFTYAYNSYCYGFLQYLAEYPSAATYCSVSGGSLAAVSDITTYNFLLQLLQTGLVSKYWLGVRENQTSGYYYYPYTQGSTVDYNDYPQYWDSYTWVYDSTLQAVSTTFWAPGEPAYGTIYDTAYYQYDSCAVASFSGRYEWQSENCNASFGYICQGSKKSSCCASDGTCYTVVNQAATFIQARQACQSMGGILAEPQSSAQMLYIMALLNSQMSGTSLGSLTPYNGQVLTSGAWVAVDATNGPFSPQGQLPWASGTQVNEIPPCGSCVYLTAQGLTLDYNCASYFNSLGSSYSSSSYYYGDSMNPICVYPQMPNISSSSSCFSS